MIDLRLIYLFDLDATWTLGMASRNACDTCVLAETQSLSIVKVSMIHETGSNSLADL
jgi:hypothetical protein